MLLDPLESNFDGVRHVAKLPTVLRNARRSRDQEVEPSTSSKANCGRHWWTLVDAAKFVGTSPLQLNTPSSYGDTAFAASASAVCCEADFVIISFYKLFGYPTGLGALIMRNEAAQLLTKYGNTSHQNQQLQSYSHSQNNYKGNGSNDFDKSRSYSNSKTGTPPLCKRYFGGGSLAAALAGAPWERFRADPASRLSDGTQHFLGIVALCAGLDRLESGAWNQIEKNKSVATTSSDSLENSGRSVSSSSSTLLDRLHPNQSSGMSRVALHVAACGHRLAAQLNGLRHPNGKPVVQLYGHWPSIAKRAESIFAQAMDRCERRREGSEDGENNHCQEATMLCNKSGKMQKKSPAALWWESWAAAVAVGGGARQVQGPVVTFSVLRPDGSMARSKYQ